MTMDLALDVETARCAAREAVALFDEPATRKSLDVLQSESVNDLAKFFGSVIPIATNLILPLAEKYGFPPTDEGACAFTEALTQHQADDEEIGVLVKRLKANFLPQLDQDLKAQTMP